MMMIFDFAPAGCCVAWCCFFVADVGALGRSTMSPIERYFCQSAGINRQLKCGDEIVGFQIQ
jgi:hypothetical protein